MDCEVSKETKVSNAQQAAKIFKAILEMESQLDKDKEHFWAMGLTNANTVKFVELVHLGTLSASLVHPREVYRPAFINPVGRVIVAHNHPSGRSHPSEEDKNITRCLELAGQTIQITLQDSIIIAGNRYCAWMESWDDRPLD